MVLQNTGQLGLVVDLADPARELTVPAEGVTSDRLVVGRGPVDEVVGAGKVEVALGGLGGVPLHAVLGRDLTKVGLDDGCRLASAQSVLVRTGSIVELALGLDERVDRSGRLTLGQLDSRGCEGCQWAEKEKKCGLHGE